MADVLPLNRENDEANFLKLMADEIKNGRYTPGMTFRHESMSYVFRKFRILYGSNYSVRFLETKFKQLKRRYREFSELMSQDGIYWNQQDNVLYGNMELLREKYRARYMFGVYNGEYNFDLMIQVFESGVMFE